MFRVSKEPMKEGQSRPAVVFIHGLIDSSDGYVVNKKLSQPFIMADAGYDVWLSNTRGNRYSHEHVSLDPSTDSTYWDNAYDFDIARHDIPSFIEYAKMKSNVKSVSIVAHSQGTQEMFIYLIHAGKEAAKSVNFFCALGPFEQILKMSPGNFI